MLVVYTLFQAISVSLPQTAYIKHVDVWLLFGLVLPFVSFILTLIEEIVKNDDNTTKLFDSTGIQSRKVSATTFRKKTSSRKKAIQFVSRVILPTVAGVFVL